MTAIIALIIALGFLNSPEEFYNLNQQQQDDLIEIVIVDDMDM